MRGPIVDPIREDARPGDSEYVLNCSLKLEPNVVMTTKRLVVEGSGGSGVTIDCSGATIDGNKVAGLSESERTANKRNMILIRSRGSGHRRNGG